MIKAIDSVPDGSLALAGNFASSDLQAKSMQLNGWGKVNYEGFVDREEIKNLLGESIAGLVILRPTINYKDSLPIKMFEYMAAGIPVIASNFPLWEEIIEENECGICVDPLDVSEISKAMNYIINNPERAEEMAQNGRKAVETEYNWEAESEKLLKLYKNL